MGAAIFVESVTTELGMLRIPKGPISALVIESRPSLILWKRVFGKTLGCTEALGMETQKDLYIELNIHNKR